MNMKWDKAFALLRALSRKRMSFIFSAMSGDMNELHTSEEFARNSPFGKRLAQGLLGLSICHGLMFRLGLFDGTGIALLNVDKWKFTALFFFGDTVHGMVSVQEKIESKSKPDRGIIHFFCAIGQSGRYGHTRRDSNHHGKKKKKNGSAGVVRAMHKAVKAKDVLPYLKEGATLATVGFTLMGACGTILNEIERSFLETGYPRNLTLLHGAGQSDRINGIQRLARPGLIKRIIGSHWGLAPRWGELIHSNEVEAYCLPQGQLVHLFFRAMASGKPGNFSKVGLGTFIDPRVEGGKINERARQSGDIVEVLQLHGEEYLFYKSQPVDVAVIRGTTADEKGNVTMEEEAVKLEAISMAQAAKANGGKVFVQVKYLAEKGTLHPKQVVIPGIYVDGIIVAENAEEEHRQSASYFFDPVFSGDARIPESASKPLPLSIRKVIGRRAVMELFPEAVVNLGTGIPGDVVGPIANEEGINQAITLTIESGVIGGIPQGGIDFGITKKNAEAIIEHGCQFDYYNGSGVDVTFMGLAEADQEGNVNVSKFGTKTVGCGGFIDITHPAKKKWFTAQPLLRAGWKRRSKTGVCGL